MANKRIQKKRDKNKLILKILELSYTEMPESLYELHRTIRMMRKMTMPALIRLGHDIIREWTIRCTPLRNMLPRLPSNTPVVEWRPVVSQYGG